MYLVLLPSGTPPSSAGLVSINREAVPFGPTPVVLSRQAAWKAACPGTRPGWAIVCVRQTTEVKILA
eukprot:12998730-Alexandrium_andersonii.AAC.1